MKQRYKPSEAEVAGEVDGDDSSSYDEQFNPMAKALGNTARLESRLVSLDDETSKHGFQFHYATGKYYHGRRKKLVYYEKVLVFFDDRHILTIRGPNAIEESIAHINKLMDKADKERKANDTTDKSS